jgi:hypothetical protein
VIDMPRQIDDRAHARRASARDDVIAVGIEFRRVEMAMTVDPHAMRDVIAFIVPPSTHQ